MKKYILTKTDGDFPVGSTMFIDGNKAYIEYEGDHPAGYYIESIMYKGEPHRVIGFTWGVLHNGSGYEAKEV